MMRLRVLRSLPQQHQNYLFEEVRKVCGDYLRSRRINASDISTEDLVSEVWEKFLAATSLPGEEPDEASDLSQWTIDEGDPSRDGRVAWLEHETGEMCTILALRHRCEDIRRKRWGRTLTSGGRRTVQIKDEFDDIPLDADQESALMQAESRDVWHGFLLLIERKHGPDDDVTKLLSVFKRHADVFDDASGMRWPVFLLITLLDRDFPPPPAWTDDRVDNAKKRLRRWLQRLAQANSFDATDLEAFFARVARTEATGSTRLKETPSRSAKLDS